MYHPYESSINGKAQHNEKIQAAENHRRAKRLQMGNQRKISFLASIIHPLISLTGGSESDKQAADPMARISS